ncbi:hypothetical protein ABZ135_05830 [Streptomyces sp. NPDC006339]|uniref:hypothetical protein n=1 Tax=Streptomyces sp. NPDC006339 TaxID=3156755 RepID=UPI0033B9D244
MDQRTEPSIQPLQGAAADPAFVPGIMGPRPARPEDRTPADETPQDGTPQDGTPQDGTSAAEPTDAAEPADEAVDAAGGEESPAPEDSGRADGGPVFEAADRRARIVADAAGVRLSLDEEKCDFRWDEIGAVETAVSRFGKRFTVTVHTPDRRWYPVDIEAPAKARIGEWESQLDAVLDAYFDEGDEGGEGDGSGEGDRSGGGDRAAGSDPAAGDA